MDESERRKDKSTAEIEAYLEDFKREFWKSIRQPKFAMEVLGLLVLIVYAIYTVRMYYANRDSADAAKKAADAAYSTQRPWLGVNDAPTVTTSGNGPNQRVRVLLVEIKNFGTSPALKVGVYAVPGTEETFRASVSKYCSEALKQTDTGMYLMPNEPYKVKRRAFDVQIAEGAPLRANETPPTLAGCIVYFGQSEDRHHTEFCYTSRSSQAPDGLLSYRCGVKQEAD
jgi:hypothetical protein